MSKIHVSYNQIHSMIKETVDSMHLNEDFQPDIMVAIGGGGFIPGMFYIILTLATTSTYNSKKIGTRTYWT
ncbi:hypothetical protein KVV02_006644 [Mortierella alpina]|uniref:Uncharacterized protein n=1 Tax=Mortierella alpina TaxID=64518 RepID=A0A9P8CU29_MORAP|nr:hypothetical protein KVV02_006644 [Mortierella alpina]